MFINYIYISLIQELKKRDGEDFKNLVTSTKRRVVINQPRFQFLSSIF